MAFKFYNPNPNEKFTDDCVIRALSKFLDKSWDMVYIELFQFVYKEKDMMNKDSIWGMYLDELGYKRKAIPDTCPYCYTINDFCKDHPNGSFIVGTGTHVVAIVDGDYYDTGDTGNYTPIYYWS